MQCIFWNYIFFLKTKWKNEKALNILVILFAFCFKINLRQIDNKVIQVDGDLLIEKQSQHYSVLVLMNHHQVYEGWY